MAAILHMVHQCITPPPPPPPPATASPPARSALLNSPYTGVIHGYELNPTAANVATNQAERLGLHGRYQVGAASKRPHAAMHVRGSGSHACKWQPWLRPPCMHVAATAAMHIAGPPSCPPPQVHSSCFFKGMEQTPADCLIANPPYLPAPGAGGGQPFCSCHQGHDASSLLHSITCQGHDALLAGKRPACCCTASPASRGGGSAQPLSAAPRARTHHAPAHNLGHGMPARRVLLLLVPADADLMMPALHGGWDGSNLTRTLMGLGYPRAMLLVAGDDRSMLGQPRHDCVPLVLRGDQLLRCGCSRHGNSRCALLEARTVEQRLSRAALMRLLHSTVPPTASPPDCALQPTPTQWRPSAMHRSRATLSPTSWSLPCPSACTAPSPRSDSTLACCRRKARLGAATAPTFWLASCLKRQHPLALSAWRMNCCAL